MVLRCSLLGHDYDEPQLEREREERGSEVVVTVEEYEECTRCGERNVISENTEVTPRAGDAATTDDPADAPESARDADEPDAPIEGADPALAGSGPAAEGSDAAVAEPDSAADDGGSTPDGVESAPAEAEPASEEEGFADERVPTTEDGEPIVDDGEILEDDEEVGDREYGEWPDSDDVGPPTADEEPTAWPETDGETDGDAEAADADEYTFSETAIDEDEEAVEDDAVVMEDAGSTAAVGGADEVATDADVASEPDDRPAPETGFERADSAPTPGENAPPDGVPTEFYCPRCDFVAPGNRGSLRPGDICPDCRKGYLGERAR